MNNTAPFCNNSKRWLIPIGWNLCSCPYQDKMKNGCGYCYYYENKIQTDSYKKKMETINESFK